ncbi:MAG: hypothetical protein M3498_01145 [Deinococcota bacterium]|nr:hypothetical protein [Deinococcota bacterium]
MPARSKRRPKRAPGKEPARADALEPVPEAGEVVLHEGLTLVEVADAADLTAIQADARLRGFILTRLSPTEAVVLPQHSQAFVKALLKAGHTPKVG